MHRAPERGALYAEYQQGIKDRKTGLATIKERENAALAAIREKWTAKRKELERLNIAKKNRRSLLQLARKHEAEEIARAKLPFQSTCEDIRGKVPFTSWNGFLQYKAGQGNEIALAILRSKLKIAEPDRVPQDSAIKEWALHGKEQPTMSRAEMQAKYAAKELAVLDNEIMSGKGKKQLLALLRMEQLAAEEITHIRGFSATVDHKGIIVFFSTQWWEDSGQRKGTLLFKQKCLHPACRPPLCSKKWGNSLWIKGNKIMRREKKLDKEHIQKQQKNMER